MNLACWLATVLVAQMPAAGLPAAPVTALAFAPDGKSIIAATPHEVAELSWPELKPLRKIAAEVAHVHDVSFAPGGKRLAIAGGQPAEAGRVAILSWPDARAEPTLEVGRDVIYRVVWHPGGHVLFLPSADKGVYLVKAGGTPAPRAGAPIALEEHSAAVTAAAVIPDKDRTLLATAGRDQTIRIWDIANPEKSLRSFDNHTGAVHDLALRPAGDDSPPILASAGADRTVRFWQPAIGRMLRFSRLASPPLAICWTKDGQRVAAACQDGRVRIVELQTARSAVELPAVEGWAYSIALAPDGRTLLVGGESGQLEAVTLPQENDR
ncbi:MAG TPA: hypothetical protein VMP01_08030 [Pirellulaceae bacterium]|nr:hypothetical protein [Pirellulaceae bacterium]